MRSHPYSIKVFANFVDDSIGTRSTTKLPALCHSMHFFAASSLREYPGLQKILDPADGGSTIEVHPRG